MYFSFVYPPIGAAAKQAAFDSINLIDICSLLSDIHSSSYGQDFQTYPTALEDKIHLSTTTTPHPTSNQ
jgi:hypothetical protein